MKTKKLVSILVGCMLCILFATAVSVCGAVPNQLTHSNVGFEDGNTGGWSYDKESTEWSVANKEDTANAHNGSRYLEVKAIAETTNNFSIKYSSDISLNTEEAYVFSAWVYVPAASDVPASTIALRVDQNSDKYDWLDASSKGWQRLSVQFTPDTTEPTLVFLLKAGVAKDTVLYFDDVTLEKATDIAAEEALRFVSDAEYSALKQDAENWSSNAETATVSFPADGAYAGTMQVQISAEGTSAISYGTTNMPSLTVDKTYEASAWVLIPEAYENTVSFAYLTAEAKKTDPRKYNNTQLINSTEGTWRRISVEFTANNTGKMQTVKFTINTTGAAILYFDTVSVVEKAAQEPVLQFLKDTTNHNDSPITLGMLKPEAGPFTVKYDIHTVDETVAGNVLVTAIYKEVNNTKQLVEVSIGVFGTEDTAVSLSMQGVTAPDSTYSVKVMLWDGLSSLHSLKCGSFSFN